MNFRLFVAKLFLFSSLFVIAGSFANAQDNVYLIKKSLISFHSNTKMELIKATSAKLKAIIDLDKRNFAFSVDMKSFEGFNSPLQKEHFNENYVESEKYPNASFVGHIIEEDDFSQNGTYNIRAKGKFSVHGIEQERIIQGNITVKNGVIKLISNFTVLLSEHDIKIPRIVHEKLASEIIISLSADFVKK